MEEIEQSPDYRFSFHQAQCKLYYMIGDNENGKYHAEKAFQAAKEIKELEKLERLNEMYHPHEN